MATSRRYDRDGGEIQAIKIYLREIGESELLRPEEEVALAAEIKKGSEAARHKMIVCNLRLVVKIAQDYSNLGLALADLVSEGNIGLVKAVERFDPAKGGKLSTYAAWWIKQAIKRALANQSKTIRLPSHLVEKIHRMKRSSALLMEKLNREPTTEELAKEVGVSTATITHWKTVGIKPSSLDAPVRESDESGTTFAEVIGDDQVRMPYDEISDKQIQAELSHQLAQLSEREREILSFRFGLGDRKEETLEEVGERFKITRERVRQIQNAAVKKLQDLMFDENHVPVLDRKTFSN